MMLVLVLVGTVLWIQGIQSEDKAIDACIGIDQAISLVLIRGILCFG